MSHSVTSQVIVPQGTITAPGISLKGNRRDDDGVDDIHAIRLRNFSALCEQRADLNQSEFGRQIEMAPSSVNRHLKGKKIGEDVARRIEKRLGLEFGWMDHVHATDVEAALLEAFRTAHEERRKAVLLLLEVPFSNLLMRRNTGRKVAS